MRGLSLYDPWASLIALGEKTVETRSWRTDYRGHVLIHTARKWDTQLAEISQTWPFIDLLPLDWKPALGQAVALADLVACRGMTEEVCAAMFAEALRCGWESSQWEIEPTRRAKEFLLGNWQPGRFGWEFRDIRPIEHVAVRGAQGLWDVPDDVAQVALQHALAREFPCALCTAILPGPQLVCQACADAREQRDGSQWLSILCAELEATNPGLQLHPHRPRQPEDEGLAV